MRAPAPALTILLGLVSLLGLTSGLTSTAGADSFDSAVKDARPIHSAKSLNALFWSQEASCAKAKNNLLRRQCEGVRNQRRSEIAQETYVMDVGGSAIDIAPNAKDKTGKSIQVTLRACLSCDEEGPVVVGKGAHKVAGKSFEAAVVSTGIKKFSKLNNAEHWSKYIGTRLRAQFLVKVPTSVERFKAAGRQGYKVDVVGYRLYDPCQGEVVVAKPASKKGPVQSSACDDEPALADDEPKVVKVPEIQHPDRLNTTQIKAAMKEVSKLTDQCHEAYGIEGMATFRMIIGGNGKLKSAEQKGDFEGTPTGICLDKAIQAASFPKSKKKETPITYPIVLQ